LQQILSEKQLTTPELAKSTGLSVRSIHNLSCGSAKSRSSRQRIQQVLQMQVWDDVPFIPEARLRLAVGDFIVLPSAEMAAELANEIGKGGQQRGRHIRICEPLVLICKPMVLSSPIERKKSEPNETQLQQSVVDHGDPKNAIEFWRGEAPPGPFRKGTGASAEVTK
jgi:hypothetical protein